MTMITFSDFEKLNIRSGRITDSRQQRAASITNEPWNSQPLWDAEKAN